VCLCLQENRFLLGVAVSCVVVTLVSMMLMLLMRRSYALEQKMSEQVGRDLPEGLTPGRTPQEKIKGCYLNKAGPELQEVLKLTRPGEYVATTAGGVLCGGCRGLGLDMEDREVHSSSCYDTCSGRLAVPGSSHKCEWHAGLLQLVVRGPRTV
jgi:hypothetical protein